jgi:predicted peptidase
MTLTKYWTRILLVPATVFLLSSTGTSLAQPANFQPPPADERAQIRSYHFSDTNEELPYALYVSSKVRPESKAPLIVALHGLGGTHTSLPRNNAIDLAEEHGYILVAPMGYNSGGWYGSPVINRNPDQPVEPANLTELSEKDVMNVLALVREEFNVDDQRIYLMGHSMGGAGALYLGVKHADVWAAIAAMAPAAFRVDPQSLATVRDLPVFIIHGLIDNVVPVDVGRGFVEVLKANGMTYEYQEPELGDHGNVISDGWPGIVAFFNKHSK